MKPWWGLLRLTPTVVSLNPWVAYILSMIIPVDLNFTTAEVDVSLAVSIISPITTNDPSGSPKVPHKGPQNSISSVSTSAINVCPLTLSNGIQSLTFCPSNAAKISLFQKTVNLEFRGMQQSLTTIIGIQSPSSITSSLNETQALKNVVLL